MQGVQVCIGGTQRGFNLNLGVRHYQKAEKRCIMVSSGYTDIPVFSIQLSKNIQCPPETSVRSLQNLIIKSHMSLAIFLRYFYSFLCNLSAIAEN